MTLLERRVRTNENLKGVYMTFERLNKIFRVKVINDKLDSGGRMSIGYFKTFELAERYVECIRKGVVSGGYDLPRLENGKETQAIWPEQNKNSDYERLNKLTEQSGRIHVHVVKVRISIECLGIPV